MSESCPTVGGLGRDGFNPDFDLKQLVLDPQSNMHIWGWLVSGFLTLVTATLTAHTIKQHLGHYYTPEIQRYKVRVLAYPAVYAILAWFSYLIYRYETVIMFFAKLFESFAVYSLYMLLQSYIRPYRKKNEGQKIAITTKVLGLVNVTLNSKWGLHFRVITDILVLQFPVKGVYCAGQFDPKGAYVYLVIINFASLSLILCVLFTYLAIFNDEWNDGRIRAHGMFWCVKLPIMFIFYFGDLLLAGLSHLGVIKDEAPSNAGGTFWPAEAIKNGYYVLLICAVMALVAILMQRYFGLDPQDYAFDDGDAATWSAYIYAFVDAFLGFVPEFFRNVFLCGGDTVTLAKKRVLLRKRQNRRRSEDERHLLTPDAMDLETAQVLQDPYPMLSEPPMALRQRRVSMDEGEDVRGGIVGGSNHRWQHQQQQQNISAVPLKPLGHIEQWESKESLIDNMAWVENPSATNILETPSVPGLALPAPPRQSRILNHNDEVAAESITRSTHFQPHELSKRTSSRGPPPNWI
ncbi:organic solute transporter Ostalpha-domain-containing protein [Dichotomocladium elegans]|nr:organic solute transporter Ostalpha-domain-containing protein [Dichotomocladium elegans]